MKILKILSLACVMAIVTVLNFSNLDVSSSNSISLAGLVSTPQAQAEDNCPAWVTNCEAYLECGNAYWDCDALYIESNTGEDCYTCVGNCSSGDPIIEAGCVIECIDGPNFTCEGGCQVNS